MTVKKLIILNKEGEKLVGNFHKANNDKKVIIVCHGLMGGKDRSFIKRFCEYLSGAGFNAYRFDFSGNGKSGGKFEDSTYSKEIKDLKSIIDYFSERGHEIGIIGHSQGGAVVILEASNDPRINFVISVAGVVYPAKFRERFIKWMGFTLKDLKEELDKRGFVKYYKKRIGKYFNVSKEFLDDMKTHKPIEKVKKIKAPILFVHGDKDVSIDIQESKDIFKAANKPKDFIITKGADHNFRQPGKLDEMIKKSIKWIKKYF